MSLIAMLLMGCGPAGPVSLIGSYEGMLTTSDDPKNLCAGGTSPFKVEIVAGPIMRPGLGSCAEFELEQTAEAVKVKPTSCAATATAAGTQINGGTLSLSGSRLDVSVDMRFGGCNVVVSGPMTKTK